MKFGTGFQLYSSSKKAFSRGFFFSTLGIPFQIRESGFRDRGNGAWDIPCPWSEGSAARKGWRGADQWQPQSELVSLHITVINWPFTDQTLSLLICL